MRIPTQSSHFSKQFNWLTQQLPGIQYNQIKPLMGDAGFRRYYRIDTSKIHVAQSSYIFVDASAEPDCFKAYCQQTNYLQHYQLPIPTIYQQDNKQCFALITDFGDQLLYHKAQQALSSATETMDIDKLNQLYQTAIDLLLQFNQCEPKAFGRFQQLDTAVMQTELGDVIHWYVKQYLALELSSNKKQALIRNFEHIAQAIMTQPRVFTYRDYHSRNLLCLDQANTPLGLIDFQDAMPGPVCYDLVSLLHDCYLNLPTTCIQLWTQYYYDNSPVLTQVSRAQFQRWFDYTLIQRRLKAIVTFVRKAIRDANLTYLDYIPHSLQLVQHTAQQYSALTTLSDFIDGCIKQVKHSNENN